MLKQFPIHPYLSKSIIPFCIALIFLSGCASTQGPQSVPMHVGQTSNPEYKKLWKASHQTIQKYFKIQKASPKKGLIITETRIDRDAKGVESKRAFVTIQQIDAGYDVTVEVPYLQYERFQNVYRDQTKNGKHVLQVERKRLEPPARTDIYLESLIQSEILATAGR
jgi:hypothetical protein